MIDMIKKRTFEPIPLKAGQEYLAIGPYEWHITALKKYLRHLLSLRYLRRVRVERYMHPYLQIDEKHVSRVDHRMPVILAEFYPGEYVVIDGQHRLSKASRLKHERIWAFKVPASVHARFMTSVESHEAFVHYHNHHDQRERLKRA